jgi:hypothetical protein
MWLGDDFALKIIGLYLIYIALVAIRGLSPSGSEVGRERRAAAARNGGQRNN